MLFEINKLIKPFIIKYLRSKFHIKTKGGLRDNESQFFRLIVTTIVDIDIADIDIIILLLPYLYIPYASTDDGEISDM